MNQPINEDVIRDYCLHHELSRPYINFNKVICVVCLLVIVAVAVSYILCLLADFPFLLIFEVIVHVILLCSAKALLKLLVKCYQRYASEKTRRQCSCMPSCSEYALLALEKYVWPKALWMTWRRVTHTCSMAGYHVDYP